MSNEKQLTSEALANISDKSKGQKIVAALYLLTNHLSDIDPLKQALRQNAIALISGNVDKVLITNLLLDFLHSAALARLVSNENVAVLENQLAQFTEQFLAGQNPSFGSLFEADKNTLSDNNLSCSKVSYKGLSSVSDKHLTLSKKETIKNNGENDLSGSELRAKRQSQILSFIDSRKSAGIKDIANLFPNVSEKTIQREVQVLVERGAINKRGNKRWSLYLSVK